MRTLVGVLVAVLVGLVLLTGVASWRWSAGTDALVERMLRASRPRGPARFDASELADLPAPVQRYLRKVIPQGFPLIRRARLQQTGAFLVSPPQGWRPFRAIHTATVAPVGFVWDARIRLAPGLDVRVRDAFVDGAGQMRAAVAGVVALADVHDTPDIATGALIRWLAESAWYPTALVPGQGVVWSAVDDSTARASVSAGPTRVSLQFHFGADSLVTRVYSAVRGRVVSGRSVPTPWQGRFSRYESAASLLIPMAGEVEWLLPAGPQVYWRGELGKVEYEGND
jgi:hypothetical protein